MAIKKLFDKGKTDKVVTSTDLQSLDAGAESERNIKQRFIDIDRYVPQIDFSNPENFARFGLAEKYYVDAVDRILRSYPYDGSEAEINEYHNESNYIDRYIFDNLYPRTTGYITFSPHDTSDDDGGWGANDTSPAAANQYYGEPTNKEYIEVRGGPHTASYGMPSGSLGVSFTGSNYYSTDIYSAAKASPAGRDGTYESNLRMNLDDGITVEFWLKKESFIASKTQKEVIFDLWNQVTSSDARHGRLRIELTASGPAESNENPFRLTFVSGAIATGAGAGFQNLPLGGATITTSKVADNKWHHYAFSIVKGASNNVVKFYRDGQLVNTVATGSTTGEVTGSLIGFIGALQTHPNLPVSTTTPSDNMVGWGKLSGSIDEFRYWKVQRTSKQIRDNYFTQVRGGTNTDISNAELGVYYKFNEGITTDSTLDSVVLDYSGRTSNGIWVGYASDARSTGSAIIESSGSNKSEYKDPVVYHTHPDVQTLRNNLAASASYHDIRNSNSIYHSLPSWIIDEDTESGGQLKNLTQIIGNYFDTLYLQIEAIPSLHSPTYQTSSGKPLPFSNRLLESKGFINSEIFANADVISAIRNLDSKREYSEDLHKIKNLIYKNIYNNLVYIFKSKGTEKSFRNLIRCFGVDEDLIRINLYADNTTQLLRNNFRPKAVKKNFIDFHQTDNQDAVVTHQTSSQAGGAKNSDSIGVTYISASHKDISTTAESEVIFPRIKSPADIGYVELTFVSSSIFGWDQADPDPDDFIKPSGGSGYQVLAVRPDSESKHASFYLIDRSNNVTIATSSMYMDVYDDQRWTFALRTRNVLTSSITPTDPSSTHGHIGTYLTGGPGDTGPSTHVEVSLYGVHTVYDQVVEEFALSGNAIHSDITVPRRYYVGARRTNVTGGTINEYSSVKVGYLRHWQMYLDNKVIQAHARDTENYGARHPLRSAYLLENALTGVWIPEYETLALNWDFSNVTGSDADGEFIVQDFSSGSLTKRRFRDPDMDPIVNNQYNARGYFFKTNTTAAVDTNYISSARYQLPEEMNSHDMVEIRTDDDLLFTRETRPIKHYFTFEKSMYQAISEEMLNMFAGIEEFNNLIGEPINRYRHEYKDMSKLRQIFYERVENIPDLDKYLSYYQWLDTALGQMLQQLVPGSSRFSDDIRNMVEDTVLTRNKYRHKLPTLRTPKTEIEGQIKGLYEHTYNWRIGHAPLNNPGTKVVHPQPQGKNCLWWKQRAERQGASLTSDKASVDRSAAQVAIIDEQREIYKKKGYSFISASVPQHTALQGTAGVTKVGVNNIPIYTGSYYPNNRFSRVYRLFMGIGMSSRSIIGAWNGQIGAGHNPAGGPNSKYTYWRKSTTPGDASKFIEISNIKDEESCVQSRHLPLAGTYPTLPNNKTPLVFQATDASAVTSKGGIAPFTLYKSSVATGYASTLSSVSIGGLSTAGTLEINNLHQDVVETGEASMQGPFTEKHVGGLPHRHVDLNTDLDSLASRLEGWKLSVSSTSIKVLSQDTDKPRGDFYRNVKAKRPVNIRNIQQLTGSGKLNSIGNFTKHYEIVQVTDRDTNKRAFIKHQGTGKFNPGGDGAESARGYSSANPAGKLGEFADVAKPDFSIQSSSVGRTDYIFVERFSAPGGPETAGDANGGPALDYASAQYSPYNSINYRNLTVRIPLKILLREHAGQFGFASGSSVSSDDYTGIAAFHKTNRNSALRYKLSSSRTVSETTVREAVRDNYYISHEIPQSDTQYAWITASLVDNEPSQRTVVLGHPHPDGMHSSSVSFTYRDGVSIGPGFIPAYNFVSASDYVTKVDSNGLRVWGNANTFDKSVNDGTYGTGFLNTDFVGLNLNIRQVIDTNTLTLTGSSQSGKTDRAVFLYGNTLAGSSTGEVISTPLGISGNPGIDATVLNSLTLNRNGPYGYPTWKQIRTGETRIGRYLRRNNIISYNETPGRHLVTEDMGRGRQEKVERFGALRTFTEPPVSSKYYPTRFRLGTRTTFKERGKEVTATRPININSTYGNDLVFFTDKKLDRDRGFTKSPPAGYKTVSEYYLRGGLESPSTPIESFINFSYKECVYPRESNTYIYKARKRNSYTNNFWRTSEVDRRALGQSKLSWHGITADSNDPATDAAIVGPGSKRSSWNLDGMREGSYVTASSDSVKAVLADTGSVGILQDISSFIHHGNKTTVTASCIYARPHLIPTTSSIRSLTGPHLAATSSISPIGGHPMGRMKIYGGITKWEAGEQAGKINADGVFVSASAVPFYDSYDDYAEDLRVMAKDYSIVPEFRISEHIDFYMKQQQGNFLAKNPKLLSIEGSPTGSSVPQNSSEDNFYSVYSTSDFLKHFASLRKDHKEIANPTELILTCKAAMKFLPYNGFYPAERTVEIATQFSKSYAAYTTHPGPSGTNDEGFANARLRPLIAPLFAPGILFNTIKSGIAVDYPVFTSSYRVNRPKDVDGETTDYYLLATSSNAPKDSGGKLSGWDYRVPFETLVKPEDYIPYVQFVDMEPHPSASMRLTSSWDGRGDDLYKMMASNFLAEVPEFFLPNGEFTTLKSKPEKQFKAFKEGEIYGMRIKIRKSYNIARQRGRIGKYFVPQDTVGDHILRDMRETFTMYSRPSAFGPPVSGRGKDIGAADYYNRVNIVDSLRGVNPGFTPPYYDGEAWCDVLFSPSSSFVTLDDILSTSRKIYWRFDHSAGGLSLANNTHPYGEMNINRFAMQLSSSFNLFQKVIEPVAEFDENGNPKSVRPGAAENSSWVIQPKFETPMYNFSDVGVHPIKNSVGTLTYPSNNSESVSRGMWHQFGVIPTDPSKGIFLEVTEIPAEFIEGRVPLYVSSAGDSNHTIDQNASAYDHRNYNSYYGGGAEINSLLDVITFEEKSIKLGQTANKKVVREGIVAVPFIEEAGVRKFFNIDKKLVNAVVKNPDTDLVGESVKSLVNSMQKFVIPPTMDFLSFPDKVDPISMYIFEFEYEFTQNDLVHMWQNLMPPTGKIVKMAETKISHKLLLNEIFGNVAERTNEPINDKLKWMVFKVKQKANNNYYSKVAGFDTDADPRYRFKFQAGRSSREASAETSFSYNWPYDFFSLIELIKLESEIKFSPIDKDIDSKLVIKSDEEKVAEGVQKEADPSKEKPKLPPRK